MIKKVKDLYAKNSKILIREIKDDSKKWKESPCTWIGRINIVKITILPKKSTDSTQFLTNKFPDKFLTSFTELSGSCDQLICDNGSKNNQWGKDSLFNKIIKCSHTVYKNKLKMD